ncbi:calbindin-32-like isoform X5 [Lytechinus variegatus]|uniref:calbindin-32-like isoform X5 n=1 Tax=Lytechinus variegatus TaxID=7654 RepID=UPI001BB170E1|nr:calbindin-32-like isoform X5 [Lytechinus variegatus]
MMDRIDKNKDGKIEMRELAELLLDPKESFLLLFRSQQPISSIEFMKIWRDFDTDNSGYIEVNELKSFMKHLVEKNNLGDISDEKLDDYAKMILKVFDSNNDGKLELKEMAKLLPTKENFLKQFQKIMGLSCCSQGKEIPGQRKLTRAEFEKVFVHYDTDNNGTIEGDELKGFLKDLMEHEGQQKKVKRIPTDAEIASLADQMIKALDNNGDGVLSVDELHMIICKR